MQTHQSLRRRGVVAVMMIMLMLMMDLVIIGLVISNIPGPLKLKLIKNV